MPILSWYDDKADQKLIELIPVLIALSKVPDVRPVLLGACSKENVYNFDLSLQLCNKILDEQ